MNTILYSHSMGEGIIIENDEQLSLREESRTVANEILIPGTLTTVSGYFNHPLKFCGVYGKNSLVFLIGKESDLFCTKTYYQVIHLITEFRLFSMFTWLSGRDFNYVNGKWK